MGIMRPMPSRIVLLGDRRDAGKTFVVEALFPFHARGTSDALLHPFGGRGVGAASQCIRRGRRLRLLPPSALKPCLDLVPSMQSQLVCRKPAHLQTADGPATMNPCALLRH